MNIYIACVFLGFLLDKIAIFPFIVGLVLGVILSNIISSENSIESLRGRMYTMYTNSMQSYQTFTKGPAEKSSK
jgi:Kef-type K+ transport system membrane component KefB